jgi:hypothetical protein
MQVLDDVCVEGGEVLVFCVWHWSVGAKQAGFGIAVGKGNSSEEASAGRVSIPVVGVVTPAFADDDELATDGGRVGGTGFRDGSLEDEGTGWE